MAKIKINKLPEGFAIRNGKVVEDTKSMRDGGMTTGDQADYGLVTTPQAYYGNTNFNDSQDESVRYSLSSVPREDANLEAEGGETVLTDLNNDGTFGLYDITGPRHTSGGVPMFLPEQSFVFSDTRKLKLSKDEMSEFDMGGAKKTPAKVSKKFGLQEYYGELNSQYSDNISATSAELMLKKNMNDLSRLAFMQEAKKEFSDGVPLASHPYLVSIGEDPIEFTAKVEEISRREAQQKALAALPPEQQQQIMMLQQFLAQQDQQQMAPQGNQQMMPSQQMQQPMGADPLAMALGDEGALTTAKFGTELGDFIKKAQEGNGEKKSTYTLNGQPATRAEYYDYFIRHNLHREFDGSINPKFLDQLTVGEKYLYGKALTPIDNYDPMTLAKSNDGDLSLTEEEFAVQFPEDVEGFVGPKQTNVQKRQNEEVSDTEIPVTKKEEAKVEGNKNPFKAGTKEHNEFNLNIKEGYSPVVVTIDGKKQLKFIKPASDERKDTRVRQKGEATEADIVGSGNRSDVYTDEVQEQQKITDASGIASFIPGMYDNVKLPDEQATADEFGYGSSLFSSEEAEEDFRFRNQSIIDELGPNWKYNFPRSDREGYDKNWRSFQNKYEEKRREYFKKKDLPYIPYFFTDESLAAAFKDDPKTYDEDGDGKIDRKWKKRRFDGARGGYTYNAPGFDIDYSPEDIRMMDLPEPDKEIITTDVKEYEGPDKLWWAQDINNLNTVGAIKDTLRLPYAPVLEDQKIDYVLDDYTGRVNANTSALNTMVNALGAYGPQAISRSNVFGKTLDANAKAINQVNQNNVRTMNQVGVMQPQLNMKVDQLNNATNKQLYDDTITALQQKDNFTNWRTGKYNELFNAGLTNLANTYNLNTINPNFNTNPNQFGIIEFTEDGRKFTEEGKYDQAYQRAKDFERAQKLIGEDNEGVQRPVTKEYLEFLYPGYYSQTTSKNSRLNNAQRDLSSNGLPPGYVQKGKKGLETKENKKRLSKWAVPFYSGKMGM
jgi:hypothetical protein